MPKIKKILVPTDFSENASSVYNLVRKTAEKYNAQVDLVHIIPEIEYLKVGSDTLGNPYSIQDDYVKLRQELTEQLEKTIKIEIPEKHRGQAFIKDSIKATRGIIEHDKANNYDLIIIGSRGLGNSIFNRGSVTEKLIRLSNTPVLSITQKHEADINTIILPTDGSQISFQALPLAHNFATKHNADIHLLSVSQFDYDKEKLVGRDARIYEYAVERLKKDVANSLINFINQSEEYSFTEEPSATKAIIKHNNRDNSSVNFFIKMEDGISAHNTIVNYAEENAQLVVMATHGRSGLSKLLIGSTAEKIVHHVNLPVLTVKPVFDEEY